MPLTGRTARATELRTFLQGTAQLVDVAAHLADSTAVEGLVATVTDLVGHPIRFASDEGRGVVGQVLNSEGGFRR